VIKRYTRTVEIATYRISIGGESIELNQEEFDRLAMEIDRQRGFIRSRDLPVGTILNDKRHSFNGNEWVLVRRKDDDSGWWVDAAGRRGYADEVIDQHIGVSITVRLP
jgi:hypothetical protein